LSKYPNIPISQLPEMFDFLRNVTKSAEEKRQEALAAYLDNTLSPRARQQFEEQLAQDPGLQAELEQQRTVRQLLRQLPPRRVPRNFTLDPAVYGRPTRQPLLVQYYPALRAATVLTAVFLFIAIGLGVYPSISYQSEAVEVTRVVAQTVVETVTVEGESVIVTRVVVETVVEQVAEETSSEEETAEEAPAAEAPAEEAGEAAQEAEEEAESDVGMTAEPTILASAPIIQATSAPLPSITPQATATESTLPRPVATEVAERAATAESPTTFSEAEPTAVVPSNADTANIEPQPTIAVSQAEEQIARPPVNTLLVVQVGLLLLLVMLTAVTLYTRRKL